MPAVADALPDCTHRVPKKKSLFFMIGPPIDPPKRFLSARVFDGSQSARNRLILNLLINRIQVAILKVVVGCAVERVCAALERWY